MVKRNNKNEDEDDYEEIPPPGDLLNDALNRRVSIAFNVTNDDDQQTKTLKYFPGTITDVQVSCNHQLHGGSKYLAGEGPTSSFLHYVKFDDKEEWWIDLHQVRNLKWLKSNDTNHYYYLPQQQQQQQKQKQKQKQKQQEDKKKSMKNVTAEKKKPGRPKTPTRAGRKYNSFVTPSPSSRYRIKREGIDGRTRRRRIDCSLKLAALDDESANINNDAEINLIDDENNDSNDYERSSFDGNETDDDDNNNSDSDYVDDDDDEQEEEEEATTTIARKRRRKAAAKSSPNNVAITKPKTPNHVTKKSIQKNNNVTNRENPDNVNKKPKHLSEKEKQRIAISNCHPITSYFARKP